MIETEQEPHNIFAIEIKDDGSYDVLASLSNKITKAAMVTFLEMEIQKMKKELNPQILTS